MHIITHGGKLERAALNREESSKDFLEVKVEKCRLGAGTADIRGRGQRFPCGRQDVELEILPVAKARPSGRQSWWGVGKRGLGRRTTRRGISRSEDSARNDGLRNTLNLAETGSSSAGPLPEEGEYQATEERVDWSARTSTARRTRSLSAPMKSGESPTAGIMR
jgi:hypothetical protein